MKNNNSRNSIWVLLWGMEIGTLTWVEDRKQAYFFFSREYFDKAGYDLCPITNPKGDNASRQAIYGPSLKNPDPDKKIYQGLPPFLADSLPDRWGNAVFEQWFREKQYTESEKTPITKLSFIGNRAMGAFEFAPMLDAGFYKDKVIDINQLYKESLLVEERLSRKSVKREEATLENIGALGTSPGGSRKKAIVSIAPDGSFHSGKTAMEEGWKHCIIKFNTPRYSLSETEKTFYDLAREAKIPMMPSSLIEIDGIKHFLTERFDRRGGKKVMMQTLAAINPDANSYEDLFKTCRRLNIPQAEINALFRQAVFNFLMNNTDDHKKNFSFVMDEKYQWHLSPAYDLTFIIDDYGIAPEKTHCMSLEGKFAEVSEQDLILFARKNDIKAPESIIKDVRAASMLFEKYARENGINGYCTEMISRRLNELGREKPMEVESIDLRIGDVDLSDIHFEMASKGNIHLCATVNGAKRKTVITPKKPVHDEIMSNGFNLMEKGLKMKIFTEFFKV